MSNTLFSNEVTLETLKKLFNDSVKNGVYRSADPSDTQTVKCPILEVTKNPDFDWAKEKLGYSTDKPNLRVFSVGDCEGKFDDQELKRAIKRGTSFSVLSIIKGDGWAFAMSGPKRLADGDSCEKEFAKAEEREALQKLSHQVSSQGPYKYVKSYTNLDTAAEVQF